MEINKLICRKCGGNHLTMKCGRQNNNDIIKKEDNDIIKKEDNDIIKKEDNDIMKEKDNDIIKKEEKGKGKGKGKGNDITRFKTYKKGYTVKISDLPIDISERELMELTSDWGNILKIRVNNYEQNSTAYIDFEYEDQADYFVESLDRTPFDSIIINVVRC